jgi:hypothetical protein
MLRLGYAVLASAYRRKLVGSRSNLAHREVDEADHATPLYVK